MTGRDEPSVAQLRSPSFSQVAARSATAIVRKDNRPSAQRTVSGSGNTGRYTSAATMESPVQTPSIEHTQDPLGHTPGPAVLGLARLEQGGWSESSGPNNSNTSSVWNGRGTHTTDSAVGTATTSNVSTPGRVSAPEELLGSGVQYTPTPILPSENSAWTKFRASTVIWPDTISKPQESSLAQPKPPLDTRKKVFRGNKDTQPVDKTTANRDRTKRVTVRSTTLDPNHLSGGKTRPIIDADEPGQLDRGFSELSVSDASQSPAATASGSTTAGQPRLRLASANGGAPDHLHSQSFHAGNPQPSPYTPASGLRSPDGYSSPMYVGTGNVPLVDMSGYESYRTTPDPYAPSMPGRAIFTSPGGSQSSDPQSPAFGPTGMLPQYHGLVRGGERMFYPSPPGSVPGNFLGSGLMMLPPGVQHYAYGAGPGSDGRSPPMMQNQMLSQGTPMTNGGMTLGPVSPIISQASPVPTDRRLAQSHGQGPQYMPGIHRRMGSNAEAFVPLSPRLPYPMPQQYGGMMPGHMHMPGYSVGGPMQGSWMGRYPDPRQIPTGPGGVMAPSSGLGAHMDARQIPGHYYNGNARSVGEFGGTARSPLLEEFRNRHAKNRKFELKDILGSVVEFSGDQHGSRFVQEKLDTASAEEKTAIFDEVLPNSRSLMTDVFGNYVIQKIFEHGTPAQRTTLAQSMEGNILSLSLGTYGCRVVQKALDHTTTEHAIKLAKELDGHVLQCVRDQNANHVVQKILERVDPLEIDFIPKTFQGQVPMLASHCYSCRVLQRILEHCNEGQSRPLLHELHAESVQLMQDQYGNYVIQWMLQHGPAEDRAQLITKIKGSVLQLSRHKYASNVVEAVIRSAKTQDLNDMIEEILTPSDALTDALDASGQAVAPAVLMMRDQFANYVLQRFLEKAEKEQRARLVQLIQTHLNSAKRLNPGHPAKHLIAIERFIETLADQDTASTADKPQKTPAT